MGENRSQDKELDIYSAFPFMESFPFEGYEIIIEKEGTDPREMGISPILLKTLGSFGTENRFNFTYIERENAFSISFYQDDICEVAEAAKGIKKLNDVALDLKEGLSERELSKKLEHVQQSKKFIKSLKLPNLLFAPMREVLDEIVKLHETSLSTDCILAVQKLNLQKLENLALTSAQADAIRTFLNFQLHYAKILLGVVIAAKIH